jgi:probable F420-dependent oxidoreductase
LKIGAIYPQIELGGDPHAFAAVACASEALGYDSFAMFDHVAGAVHAGREPPLWGPYTESDPFHDPMVALAFVAGITERIELVAGILVLPQRQTLLAARQAADIDLLSNGRLRMGVGAGWNYVEFAALGQDFHTRGKRLSEQIQLLRRLWAEPVVDFTGEFHRIDRLALNPRPKRRIPIYCGGVTEPAYRRAARLADGFIFGGAPERVISAWQEIQRYLDEEGRDLTSFGADYQFPDGTDDVGSFDLLRRWEDAGGTHCAVRTMKLGFTTADQHIDHLARLRAKFGSAGNNR